MTATEILQMLADRHYTDIFVPECKLGPTWGATHRRLDAWAMRCSWTRPAFVGYEIKVSRSDFRADRKWREYLPPLARFYFVTPNGLVEPSEVEDPAGLLAVSRTGRVLRTIKRAKPMDPCPEALSLLFQYVLMNRSEITDRPRHGTHRRSTEFERARYEQRILWERRRRKRVGHLYAYLLSERAKDQA